MLLLWVPAAQNSFGQYYFGGATFGPGNKPLVFVKLFMRSTGLMHQSGGSAAFGIPSAIASDSVVCVAEGFDTLRALLVAGGQNLLALRLNTHNLEQLRQRSRLSSLTQNLIKDPALVKQVLGETYSETLENGFLETLHYPSTGFAPNVNNAAYSNIRRFINTHSVVPPNAVRLEEMLNYFSLGTAAPPAPDKLFNIETQISDCPWKPGNLLLFINARARKLDLGNVPPANLVFLIDNSGSMDAPNRLALLKSGFKMLVNTLRDIDRVSIVTYGGAAGISLPPTSGGDKAKIDSALESITPGGSTPGSNGIVLAYELATANRIAGGNNRVILATDGDFNVGITSEAQLESLIDGYKNSGVYLTCLGVGMGNYKDSKIEVLARHGNGNFAYLDSEAEAEKVLVRELTQTLYAVATNVTFHLKLNAGIIGKYKLLGYDNRLEAIRSSESRLIGGEIGSGYSLLTVMEIEPADTTAAWRARSAAEIAGQLELRYHLATAAGDSVSLSQAIPFNYQPFNGIHPQLRFASAVAIFGSVLRHPETAGPGQFNLMRQIALASAGSTNAQQAGFLSLINEAQALYLPQKKAARKW